MPQQRRRDGGLDVAPQQDPAEDRAAMAEYLRHHTTDSDEEMSVTRLRTLLDKTPEGNA